MDSNNKNEIPAGVRFSSENQPTPQAKSAGWQRKREAMAFLDLVVKFMDYTQEQIDVIEFSKMTVREKMAFEFVVANMKNPNYLFKWIDKHISDAPRDVDIKTNGKDITGFKIEHVYDTADTGNESI